MHAVNSAAGAGQCAGGQVLRALGTRPFSSLFAPARKLDMCARDARRFRGRAFVISLGAHVRARIYARESEASVERDRFVDCAGLVRGSGNHCFDGM